MDIVEMYANSARLIAAVSTQQTRYLYHRIDWSARMICIKGARGVGKTTMMLQYLKLNALPGGAAIYVSLDDLYFTEHRLLELVEYHYLHGGTHLFLDEVHRYPQDRWAQEMKNIYDRYPSLHVVFTGSSLLQVDFSMADLSRRTVFYTLQGLSFREFLMFEGCEELPAYPLEQLLAEHTRMASGIVPHTSVIPLFEKYLRYGYYPFYKEAIESYTLRLQQVVTVILENDLPAVEKVEYASIRKMRHLLVVLSQMVPYTLNATKMGALVGTTRQQVVRMFEILERAALLIVLHSGKGNLRQLAKPEKIYLENANLMFALSSTPDTGTVRETFFANQLKQAHTLAAPERGDFLVDDSLLFEVGGKTKTFEQIKDIPNSYLAVDGVEYGAANRIPLWLFGLLY